MTKDKMWKAIESEMKLSRKLLPVLPDHICSAASFVAIESGKLMIAAAGVKYRQDNKEELQNAAVRNIVMAIRFLERLK